MFNIFFQSFRRKSKNQITAQIGVCQKVGGDVAGINGEEIL
jgi:hypothetical protein